MSSYTITAIDENKWHITVTFEATGGTTVTNTICDLPLGDKEAVKTELARRLLAWEEGLPVSRPIDNTLPALVNHKQNVNKGNQGNH